MISAGQRERATQNRVIKLFQAELGYRYLGDWHTRENNRNVEPELLTAWLVGRGVDAALIPKVLRQLDRAASLGEGRLLYDANKEVYRLLRYGVKEKVGAGEQNQTVWLVDWTNPQAISYQEYLEKVRELAKQVKHPQSHSQSAYPESINTAARRALYDNLGKDELLVAKIDTAVRYTKKADWHGDRFKEREIAFAIAEEIKDYEVEVREVMELVKAQKEYL